MRAAGTYKLIYKGQEAIGKYITEHNGIKVMQPYWLIDGSPVPFYDDEFDNIGKMINNEDKNTTI